MQRRILFLTVNAPSRLLPTSFGFLSGLFVFALAARLGPIALFGDLPIDLDMLQYDMLARSLAAGNGYRWYAAEDAKQFAENLNRLGFDAELPEDPLGIPTSFRAPLYPFTLSLIYRLTTENGRILSARLVQAVLGAFTSLLTYALGRAVKLRERPSRVAGMIVAVYSLLLFYPLGLVTENLFIPLLLLTLLALLKAHKTGALPQTIVAGILVGLTALTRSIVVILWPWWLYWFYRWTSDRRRARLLSSILLTAMLVVTVPWSVRNTLLHGEPVWLESSLGYVLYLGYHPTATGTVPARVTMELLTIQDDLQRNEIGMHSAWRFITSNPQRAVRQVFQRFGTLWGLEWREFRFFYHNNYLGEWRPWLIVMTLLWFCLPLIILLPSAIYGMISFETCADRQILLSVVFGLTIVHILTLADPRYHLPVVPVLAVFAAHGWTTRKDRQTLRIALVASLPFLLIWTLEILHEWGRLQVMLAPRGNLTYWDY